jgi:hypothetical protein
MLPELPDNDDYATSNKVTYDGRARARGINWSNAAYHIFETPVSSWSGKEFQTLFDDETDELSIDESWEEPEI